MLYLQNLKDAEAKDYSQREFQSKLASAVAGALDPEVGPESFIDFSKYRRDLPAAFGNKQAGELMSMLLGMDDDERLAELQKTLDEQKEELEGEKTKKSQVENTLAYLQELIPLSQQGQKNLPKDLEDLEGLDPTGDSAWLYDILWTSCLQWMDTRLRQIRSFAGYKENGPKPNQPAGLRERTTIINNRLHGGDLRADAVMSSIHFGEYRHYNVHYDTFIRESFKKMYQLSIDDGLWLGECQNTRECPRGDATARLTMLGKQRGMADPSQEGLTGRVP